MVEIAELRREEERGGSSQRSAPLGVLSASRRCAQHYIFSRTPALWFFLGPNYQPPAPPPAPPQYVLQVE